MAGIFPDGGILPQNAQNSLPSPLVGAECDALWHGARCNPKFDPASANAVIAELLNVINAQGLAYQCDRLDNLQKAVEHHTIAGTTALSFSRSTPFTVPQGEDRGLGAGTFTINNTYHRTIPCLVLYDWTLQFQQLKQGVPLDINFEVFNDAARLDRVFYMPQRLRGFSEPTVQFALNPFKAAVPNVPPGGRVYYWNIRATTPEADAWRIQYEDVAVKVAVYGIATNVQDGVSSTSFSV